MQQRENTLKLRQDNLYWEFNTDTQLVDILWILEIDGVGFYQKTKSLNIFGAKNVWNQALEAAALIVQPNPHVDEERECQEIAKQIRALKK